MGLSACFLLLSANDNKGKELNATFKTSIVPVQTIPTTWTFHRQTQTVVFFHWLMVFHWSQSALSSAFWNHLETSPLVCLAITTNPPLRRASNYLLFSLVIADLIVTLMCEPLILEFISKLTFFHGCITSLKQLAYNTLVSLSCQTSIIHLTSISLDRFVAVGFPRRHKIFIEKVDLRWCS